MPRLIDANALLKRLRISYLYHKVNPYIVNAPTVDAVEVVRCKDCKHYDDSEGICWCKINSRFFSGGVDWHGFPEDGYCSYGERKDNERKAD